MRHAAATAFQVLLELPVNVACQGRSIRRSVAALVVPTPAVGIRDREPGLFHRERVARARGLDDRGHRSAHPCDCKRAREDVLASLGKTFASLERYAVGWGGRADTFLRGGRLKYFLDGVTASGSSLARQGAPRVSAFPRSARAAEQPPPPLQPQPQPGFIS